MGKPQISIGMQGTVCDTENWWFVMGIELAGKRNQGWCNHLRKTNWSRKSWYLGQFANCIRITTHQPFQCRTEPSKSGYNCLFILHSDVFKAITFCEDVRIEWARGLEESPLLRLYSRDVRTFCILTIWYLLATIRDDSTLSIRHFDPTSVRIGMLPRAISSLSSQSVKAPHWSVDISGNSDTYSWKSQNVPARGKIGQLPAFHRNSTYVSKVWGRGEEEIWVANTIYIYM